MRNVDLIRELWGIWREQGPGAILERFDEFYSADLHWHPPASDLVGAYVGRDGYAQWMKALAETWEVFELSDDEHRELSPSAVLSTAHLHGRGAASGVELDQRMFMIVGFHDGRIHWARAWFDAAEAEAAVAAVERGEEVPA